MTTPLRALAVITVLALLASACAARSVRVAELRDQPDKYRDQRVTVTGVVTNSFGIPLVPFQLYNVDDGTGEITVVARDSRAPAKGARVRVRGKINEFAVIGGRSIGLHLQEEDRRTAS